MGASGHPQMSPGISGDLQRAQTSQEATTTTKATAGSRLTVGTSNKKSACRQVPHGNFLSPDGPGDPQTPWDTSGSSRIDDTCALRFLIARFLIVGACCRPLGQ